MNSRQSATLSTFNPKSSVLCPQTRHITSQYLALEQLKAHHNMVSSAKGSIDTSAPKSLQSYLSSIDRKKKHYWQQGNRLIPQSTTLENLSKTLMFQTGEELRVTGDEEPDAKDTVVATDENISTSLNKSIQAGVPFPQFSSKIADKISWYLEAVSHGEFQQTIPNHHNLSSNNFRQSNSVVSLSSSLRSGKVIKGDLMDWHKKSFTSAQRLFSPRITANNTAKSKVLGMRCYNPPRKRKENSSINSSDTFESFEDEEEEEDDDDEQKEVEDAKTEDDTIEDEVKNEVSVKGSTTHRDWLNEQALRAQIRRKLKATNRRNSLGHSFNDVIVKPDSNTTNVFNRDEEVMYLKFLSDVTEDILRSGVYTDRAIQRTFDFHLQFYPKDTNKEKIQHLLDQVLEGLQISTEDNDELFQRNIPITHMKESDLQSSTPPEKDHMSNGLNQFTASSVEQTSQIIDNIAASDVLSTDRKVAEVVDNTSQSEADDIS